MISCIGCVVWTAAAACAAVAGPVEWISPTSGNWEVGTNWSGGTAPGNAADPIILGLNNSYSVALRDQRFIGPLAVQNPDAALRMYAGSNITILGDIENNGLIQINTDSLDAATMLLPVLDLELSGTGRLRLDAPNRTAAQLNAAQLHLTHGSEHRIEGSGWIRSRTLLNHGVISSVPDGLSRLWVEGDITQGMGGMIVSDGQQVVFRGDTAITGGTLDSMNGGSFKSEAASLGLRDTVIQGNLDLELGFRREFMFAGTITHHGEITTTLSASGGDLLIAVVEDTLLTGESRFRFQCAFSGHVGEGCEIVVTNNSVFTLDRDVVLEGRGLVRITEGSTLMNLGRIEANLPGEALVIEGHLSGPGELVANNAMIAIDGVCEGQQISVFGSPDLLRVSNALLRDVRFLTDFTYQGTGPSMRIGGVIETDHVIEIPFREGLFAAEDCVLTGSGEVDLGIQLNVGSNSNLTIDDGFQITGGGTITTSFQDGLITLAGTLMGPSRINADILGAGGVIYASPSDTELFRSDLTGVVLRTLADESFFVPNGSNVTTLTDTHLMGNLMLHRDAEFRENLVNDGFISVASDSALTLAPGGHISGTGIIELNGIGNDLSQIETIGAPGISIGSGITIRGEGAVVGDIELGGTLEVGGVSGRITLDGVSLTEDARIVLYIAQNINPTIHDRVILAPGGNFRLAGTLEIVAGPESLKPGMRWEILSGAPMESDFDRLVFPDVPTGWRFFTEKEDAWYGIVLTCSADLNRDFRHNFNDVSAFIVGFVEQRWIADMNQDGMWNFVDVSAFIESYSSGCLID